MNKHFTKLLSLALLLFGWASVDGQVFFLNENFNGTTGSTPPTGWSNNTLSGGVNDTWRFNNPGGRAINNPMSSPAAVFDSDDYSAGGGAEDVTLESPSFNTTGIPAISLKFDHQFQGGFGGQGTVEVWDGSSWNQVYNTTATVATKTENINISSFAANRSDVKVRFRWRGNFSWWWLVDNVQVFYTVDVQPVSVDDPAAPCGSTTDSVKVSVRNNSAFTVKDIPVAIEMSGGLLSGIQRDTIDSIPASGVVQAVFAGGNTTAGGQLDIKAWTALSGDDTKGNDTINNFSLTVVGTPDDPTITNGTRCGAGSVLISANTTKSTDSIVWYPTNSPSGAPLSRDRMFNTPLISSTTDFYAFALRGDATPKQILTTFASGNGQTGNMFNVTPLKDIILDSLTFSPQGTATGSWTVDVYYKQGTYVGFNTNQGAWTLHGTFTATGTANVANGITFDIADLSLDKNQLYGIYVRVASGPSGGVNYTNGANTYNNGDILVETGIGVPGLFGGQFNPRTWNGRLHYKEVGCFSNGVAVTATINPVAAGTTVVGLTGSKGTFNGGTMVAPDVNASPDSIKYRLVTPTGFNNSDYGNSGTWVVSSISATTQNGSVVPSSMYSFVDPTSTSDGEFRMHTDTTFNDSVICVNINVRRLDNGCDTTITRCIYIAPRPRAGFNVNTVCKGDVTEFTNATYLQAGTLKYEWDFGAPPATSDLADPFFTYATAGTYTVTLKVESDRGYRDSVTQTVTVKEIPTAGFEIVNACEGDPLQFTSNSILPTGTPTYTWNYGDGSAPGSGATSTHQYAFPGIYPVKLTVEVNGCASDITKYGTQAPRSTPDFTFTALQCDNANVSFTNNTTAPAFGNVAYTWKLGDNTEQNRKDVNHTYNVFKSYDVVLIGRTDLGCKDSVVKTITLRESPKADFNVTGSTCNGDVLTFNNTTNQPTGGTNTYEWEFGDANTSTDMSPTHQYVGPGVKPVTLIARNTNGCESQTIKNVTIELKPNADFVAKDVCLGEETKFTNNSNIGDGSPLTYEWDIDGTTSTNVNEATTFSTDGSKPVQLIAISSNGCNDTVTRNVEVHPKPVAVAQIASQLSFDGAFSFATNTQGASYKWIFGDGGTAETQNATYKYPIDGRYIVRLIVISDKGCVGIDSDTLFVNRLSVNDNFLANSVKLYPNPGNGAFDLEFEGINASDIKSIVVLNNLGQKVAVLDTKAISSNKLAVNIASEAAGIYFIQVETTNGKASFKYNLVK
jgi:PKD repeat protein